jgi:ATP-binding cassette subfamily C (CFTR/MRP) protein 1
MIVRILNLFTKDTNVVDQVLARVSACHNLVMTSLSERCSQVIQFVVRTSCSTIGIIIVIGSSFPPFLIAIIPLGWLYNRFMTWVPLSKYLAVSYICPTDIILLPRGSFSA